MNIRHAPASSGVGNALLPRPPGMLVEESTADQEPAAMPLDLAQIRREERLGGLLKHFYRDAA